MAADKEEVAEANGLHVHPEDPAAVHADDGMALSQAEKRLHAPHGALPFSPSEEADFERTVDEERAASMPSVEKWEDLTFKKEFPKGKIHRVDPDFGSTLTVSNRDSQ
jgi:hypothetical protein